SSDVCSSDLPGHRVAEASASWRAFRSSAAFALALQQNAGVLAQFAEMSADLADCLCQRGDSLVELAILDKDRGQEPDHCASAWQDQDATLLHRLDRRRRRLLQLDGEHQSAPADLADLGQPEVTDTLLKTRPGTGRAGMKRIIREHFEGCGSGGADQWIAGEGGPMAPLGHAVADRLGGDGHADWQAVGNRLRQAEDVGHDVLAREGKRTAGPKSRLDLV